MEKSFKSILWKRFSFKHTKGKYLTIYVDPQLSPLPGSSNNLVCFWFFFLIEFFSITQIWIKHVNIDTFSTPQSSLAHIEDKHFPILHTAIDLFILNWLYGEINCIAKLIELLKFESAINSKLLFYFLFIIIITTKIIVFLMLKFSSLFNHGAASWCNEISLYFKS